MTAVMTAPPRVSPAGEPDAERHRRRRRRVRENGAGWGLLAPSVIILGVMVGWPALLMVIQSFTDYSIKNKVQGTLPEFVGLDNYVRLFTNSDFPIVLVRSLGLMAVMTALILLLGTLVAVLMTRLGKAWRITVSVGLLLAWAMPPLAATVVWGWMFDTDYGVVNWLLNTLTGTNDFRGHGWLINPWSFFVVLTIIVVWQGVPFVAFTTYAGLGQVPTEVLEAASLDGATGFQRFRLVTMPYLRNIFIVMLVLQVIWNLRIFTQVYALQSRGGLASETNVLGTYSSGRVPGSSGSPAPSGS